MFFSTLLMLSAIAGLVAAAPDAPVTSGNPLGATHMAVLPNSNFTTIRGTVTGTTNNNGTGVIFTVAFNNVPSSGGPYIYHIHNDPVPSDGNCTGAGPHLDPETRGEKPPCDPGTPQQCQVGDLAGKHGSFNAVAYTAQSVKFPNGTASMITSYKNGTNNLNLRYLDLYVSSEPGSPAYFGNRSVVVHDGAGTRLTCANFTMLTGGTASNSTGSASTLTASASASTSTETASESTAKVSGASSTPVAEGTATGGAAAEGTSAGSTPSNTGAATATSSTGAVETFKGDATAKSLSAGAAVLAAAAFFL